MQHLASVTSAISSAGQAFGLISSTSTGSTKPKQEWIDPICAIVALSILNFYPHGTKLSFRDHTVSFDAPLAFGLQGLKRRVQGSSSHDLYNLTSPIYYAAIWLRPFENERTRLIFELAKSAIENMISHTYSEQPDVQQYLTTTHARMIERALKGKAIPTDKFFLADLSQNPYTQFSKEYWLCRPSPLDLILDALNIALDKSRRKEPTINQTKLIEGQLEEAYKHHRELVESIASGRGKRPASEPRIEAFIPSLQSFPTALHDLSLHPAAEEPRAMLSKDTEDNNVATSQEAQAPTSTSTIVATRIRSKNDKR